MPTPGTITDHFDIAFISLYVFWLAFAFLVFWLHRESKREGYPLVTDRPDRIKVVGFPGMPPPKTFVTHDGHSITVPRQNEVEPPMTGAIQASGGFGAPYIPTGNPMVDGVGPAAWVQRADVPDLTYDDGVPKIIPLRTAPGWGLAEEDPDPRGMLVTGADGKVAGTCVDVWIDLSEVIARYIEVDLGSRSVLVPMTLIRVDGEAKKIRVVSVLAKQFVDAPGLANPNQVTLREEDRICAYFASGHMYALPERQEPLI
jgi:photosynthetic reaction center H subunit